jgi:hypothetical protein
MSFISGEEVNSATSLGFGLDISIFLIFLTPFEFSSSVS